MLIRCWGARGSIPVSGEPYLKYGGDTTCLEIRTHDDQVVIIDAGSGIRRLGNRLIAEGRSHYAMLFTHAHWDHLMGFPFFKPIYCPNTHISMYGCPFVQNSIATMIARVMAPPNFPVNYTDIRARITYHDSCQTQFAIASLAVDSIPLSHPNEGMGYRFIEGDKTFIFLTDNELSYRHPGGRDYEEYVRFSADADLLIHDAEYSEQEYSSTRTWGHSTYRDALRLAIEANVKKLGLFHHNQEHCDDTVEEIVTDCRRIIAAAGSSLECFALGQTMEVLL